MASPGESAGHRAAGIGNISSELVASKQGYESVMQFHRIVSCLLIDPVWWDVEPGDKLEATTRGTGHGDDRSGGGGENAIPKGGLDKAT